MFGLNAVADIAVPVELLRYLGIVCVFFKLVTVTLLKTVPERLVTVLLRNFFLFD